MDDSRGMTSEVNLTLTLIHSNTRAHMYTHPHTNMHTHHHKHTCTHAHIHESR